jgi:hypothetical protein
MADDLLNGRGAAGWELAAVLEFAGPGRRPL